MRPLPSELPPRDDLLACLYDWEHDAFQDDVEMYANFARRSGGPVLELACGSGRVLQGIAAQGLQVVGLDRSPAMLRRAEDRLSRARMTLGAAQKKSRNATLVQGDLDGELPVGQFPLILLALDGLGLLQDRAAQSRLRSGGLLVAPGGVLVLDLVHLARIADEPQGLCVLQRQGTSQELDMDVTKWLVRTVDWATQSLTLSSFYDLTAGDGPLRRISSTVELRFFSQHEAALLLETAGLRVDEVFGGYDLCPLSDASERLIVVAARGSRSTAVD